MQNNNEPRISHSFRLKMSGYTISALGLCGAVFCRHLSASCLPWLSLYEIFFVGLGLIIIGLRLESVIRFFRIGNIRRVIRVKAGFTFVFCVGCAIILFVSGWVYSGPKLSDFGIIRPKIYETGYTEPPVFLPGRPVKLSVASGTRRFHKESMDGLWRASDVTVEFKSQDGSLISEFSDVSTIISGESWEYSDEDGIQIKYYNKGTGSIIPEKIINKPFFPWVQIDVPADPGLKGKTGTVSVRMTVTYPFLISEDKYDLSEAKFFEDIPFHVANDEEYSNYQKYLTAEMNWELFRKIRLYALLVFGAFIIVLRPYLKNR